MRKIFFTLLFCLPLTLHAQTNLSEAQQKAIEAKRVAEEAARKAEEARIAALKAEAAAKAAEAAQAQAEAEAALKAAQEANEDAEAKAKSAEPGQSTMAAEAAEPLTKAAETETKKIDSPGAANAEISRWAAQSKKAAANDASKVDYLEGAVPEIDGTVTWTLSLDVPGQTADQIFDKMGQIAYEMTQEENQLENSRIALADKDNHQLAVSFHEWLVFSRHALSLDRTELRFVLMATASDGHLDVTMSRINYLYEKERTGGEKYKAETWITDKYALNKAKTKLYPVSGKFRRKTIDRKNEIFNRITARFSTTD